MNLQPNKQDRIELDLTPLIDVVFLLLIFFMVSTTFDKESLIKVDLPEATTTDEPPEQDKDILDIVVDAEGRYYVNRLEVLNKKPETLKQAIIKAVQARRDLPVIITADANTTHQSVVIVMDVASQLGLTHMTFSAKKPVSED